MDFVSHQAALGSVPRSIADPITTNDVNISDFLNILNAAKESKKLKRFIYAASSSTYGDSSELPKIEGREGKILSPYAVTKAVNEMYADVFSKVNNFHSIGLRYFNVFGPKQSPNGAYAAVIPLFVDAIIKGNQPTINGYGSVSRDFTYVDNAVQANILALFTENIEGVNQVYNVACGERTTLKELWAILKEVSGSDIEPIYGQPRKGDIPHSLADISKANNFLSYKEKVKIREGLKKSFNWYKIAFKFI